MLATSNAFRLHSDTKTVPKVTLQSPRVLPKDPLRNHSGIILMVFCMTGARDLSRWLMAIQMTPKDSLSGRIFKLSYAFSLS